MGCLPHIPPSPERRMEVPGATTVGRRWLQRDKLEGGCQGGLCKAHLELSGCRTNGSQWGPSGADRKGPRTQAPAAASPDLAREAPLPGKGPSHEHDQETWQTEGGAPPLVGGLGSGYPPPLGTTGNR
jgi:hypothetical protein